MSESNLMLDKSVIIIGAAIAVTSRMTRPLSNVCLFGVRLTA